MQIHSSLHAATRVMHAKYSALAVGEQALADGHQVGELVIAAPVHLALVLAVAAALGLVEADGVVRVVVHPAVIIAPKNNHSCKHKRPFSQKTKSRGTIASWKRTLACIAYRSARGAGRGGGPRPSLSLTSPLLACKPEDRLHAPSSLYVLPQASSWPPEVLVEDAFSNKPVNHQSIYVSLNLT